MEDLPTDIYTELCQNYLNALAIARLRKTCTTIREKTQKIWDRIEVERVRQYSRCHIYTITNDQDLTKEFPGMIRGDIITTTDKDLYIYDGTRILPNEPWVVLSEVNISRQFTFPEFPLRYFNNHSVYVWIDHLTVTELVNNRISYDLSFIERNKIKYNVILEGDVDKLEEAIEYNWSIYRQQEYDWSKYYYLTYILSEEYHGKYDPDFSFVLRIGPRYAFEFKITFK